MVSCHHRSCRFPGELNAAESQADQRLFGSRPPRHARRAKSAHARTRPCRSRDHVSRKPALPDPCGDPSLGCAHPPAPRPLGEVSRWGDAPGLDVEPALEASVPSRPAGSLDAARDRSDPQLPERPRHDGDDLFRSGGRRPVPRGREPPRPNSRRGRGIGRDCGRRAFPRVPRGALALRRSRGNTPGRGLAPRLFAHRAAVRLETSSLRIYRVFVSR